MPGLLTRSAQFGNASSAALVGGGSVTAAACPGGGIWSKHRDCITSDQLQKFWSELPIQARQELLRIDKQTLFEQARKNLYCSRCNGLLLEGFSQIVMYGKSLQQEGAGLHSPSKTVSTKTQHAELDQVQDPSVHPWGGLATTKDGILTLLDCFINARSLEALQNVFDSARARERERELLYPDACGGGGRGWISQGMPNYGRGHGTRETCALHTARLSCDTLVDFWSALGDETRSSLLRMKEEDFIERLMYRFDSKRFCRDCRRNVIREFKELKELKRMRREPCCTSWFCVADTAFQYEVSEDTVQADWHQSFTDTVGTYHHFEWAIGTGEGKSDILDFEDVGMNGKVQVNGLDLGGLSACFITLRAWKLDGRCTELCVKAHALKGQRCVHRRLIVGDGFVTITKGESIRRFFEHAEEAEEEEDDDAMDKDSNELDGDGSRPQKHAKSPELAREFLLDAATVIFKEQVEKAFREGTARQNAHSIFVCLALKLLEERVHVACKEIITLEKQTKLLEEEEREKRAEEERKERKRTKEREKKLRRKERLKDKERERERKLVELKSLDSASPTSLDGSPKANHDDSLNNLDSCDSISEPGDVSVLAGPVSPDVANEQSSSGCIDEKNLRSDSLQHWFHVDGGLNARDCNGSFITEQSKSSRRKLRFRKDSLIDQGHQASNWYDKRRPSIDNGCTIDVDESDGSTVASCRSMNGIHRPLRERDKNNIRNFNPKFGEKFNCSNSRTRERYEFQSCSCKQHGDYRAKGGYHISTSRPGKEINTANKPETTLDMPRSFYRTVKYINGCNLPDNSVISKVKQDGGAPSKDVLHVKQVWEPMDSRKKCSRSSSDPEITLGTAGKVDPPVNIVYNKDENGYQHPHSLHAHDDLCSSGHSEDLGKAASYQVHEDRSKNVDKSGSCTDNGCQTRFVPIAKSDCYSKDDLEEGSCPILSPFPLSSGCDPGTSPSSSDNCSSCLSEGDTSTSSSSAQNAESSSTSDSEDASQQSDGRDVLMCNGSSFCNLPEESSENNCKTSRAGSLIRTTAGSPAKICIEDSFARGKQTKAVQNSDNGRCGYDMAPPQQHMLPMHTHSMRMPIFPPPSVGYLSQNTVSWSAAPANGLMPYSQHNRYVFPSHVGYGLPASQSSDFCMQYNTPKPLIAPMFDMSQHVLHQAANRINAAHPKEHGKNFDTCGPQQVSPAVDPIGSLHPLERSCQSRQLPLKQWSSGQNCSVKNAANPHDDSSSFSLFHFGGPVPGVAAGYNSSLSLKEESAGGFVSNSPAVQAHTCSKEETKVEEYSLFSARNGARFPFF